MAKMNPEVKARWVAALRSGEYRQTTGQLRKGSKYCCLGVLCDLYAREQEFDLELAWDSPYRHGLESEDAALPASSVQEWAGMKSSDGGPGRNPRVSIAGVAAELAKHNDGSDVLTPRTFAEIADAIEEQL